MRRGIYKGAIRAVAMLLWLSIHVAASAAGALAPSDVWTASNASGARFSGDGSSVLTTSATGFQMRRTSDGRLEKTITLPAASRAYDAYAFSPDKQYVALTYRASGVTRIDLFSVASGALVRSIDSAAVRNARGIDLSSQGRVALFERYAYSDGGYVRVFDTSTGALLTKQGPYTRNSTTELRFSPDGDHLAIGERMPTGSGVRILNTSNWATEQFLGNGAFLFRWSRDSASVFVGLSALDGSSVVYDEVAVPNGDMLGTTHIDSTRYYANAVTPDGRFFLATTPSQDALAFLRAGDGQVRLSYVLAPRAGVGSVSPAGDLFAYTTCPDGGFCTLHVARVPAL